MAYLTEMLLEPNQYRQTSDVTVWMATQLHQFVDNLTLLHESNDCASVVILSV